MPWLFLIFIVTPILEMIVLIEVGGIIGTMPTIALVFLTAIVGVTMLRIQGISTLFRFNEKLSSGELPAEEVIGGMMLVLSGAFLLTPGFVTDSIGFLFLVPQFRTLAARRLIAKQIFANASFQQGFGQNPFGFEEGSGQVYEARRRNESAQDTSREEPENLILLDKDEDDGRPR